MIEKDYHKTTNYENHSSTISLVLVMAITMIISILTTSVIFLSTRRPAKDLSSCRLVSEQSSRIVSSDGVITDDAIMAMNGRNVAYNAAITKCLEVVSE
nr:MAG TPA: hypothetical protein [Caudoviricetes sp.]